LGSEKKTIEDLIEELTNLGVASREEAALAIGQLEDDKGIDPLLKVLKEDESEDVRAAAAKSLGNYFDNKRTIRELAKTILSEESPIVRMAIVNALGQKEEASAVKPLLPLLEKEEVVYVREAIIEAIGNTKSKKFSDDILKVLKNDEVIEARVQAAIALAKIADKIQIKNQLNF